MVTNGPGLSASETHRIALSGANRLLLHSEGKGWQNIYASLATESPWAGTLPSVPHHCIVHCLHQSAIVQREVAGHETRVAKFAARNLAIIPGGISSNWDINGRPDVLLLYLSKVLMDDLLKQAFGESKDVASLIPRMAFHDPVLEQLALAIMEALRDDARPTQFYVNQLAMAMAARLISHHMEYASDKAPESKIDTTNLTGRLRRVCSYIDSSLGGGVALSQLAEEAHLSQDHLIRSFRDYLGMTPHQYVMKRRIDKARELLLSTSIPIAELSVTMGFSDQSHLSTAFRKAVGVSPARYRKLSRS